MSINDRELQARRERIATAVLPGIVVATAIIGMHIKDNPDQSGKGIKMLKDMIPAEAALRHADELIALLDADEKES